MSHLLTERRFKILAGAVIATAAAYQLPSAVEAAPIYNIKMRISTTSTNVLTPGAANYGSSLSVTTGQTVFYQLLGNMSPAGTVNNTFIDASHPNTTLVAQVQDPDQTLPSGATAGDGAQSWKGDIFDTAAANIAVAFRATGGTPASTSGRLQNS